MKRIITHTSRRQMLLTLGLLGLGGCWGSFSLTGKVYDWNGSFGSKWASWAVFLVFIILPVYGTLLFLDAIVFNTIDFFSGKNPIKRSADLGRGHRLVMSGDEERTRLRVEHYDQDTLVRVFHVERLGEDEIRISDDAGQARLHVAGHRGGARLRDEGGRTIADLDRQAYRRAVEASEAGEPLADRVIEGLDDAALGRVLATSDRLGRSGMI